MFGLGSFYEIPNVWVEMPFLFFKDNHLVFELLFKEKSVTLPLMGYMNISINI